MQRRDDKVQGTEQGADTEKRNAEDPEILSVAAELRRWDSAQGRVGGPA